MDTKRQSVADSFQKGVERGRLLELRTNRNLCLEFVEELRVYTVEVLMERYPRQAPKLIQKFLTIIAIDLEGKPTEMWPQDKRLRCSVELRNLLAPQLGHWVQATAKQIHPPEPEEGSPWTLDSPSEQLRLEMKQIVEDLAGAAELALEYYSRPVGSTLEFAHGVYAALKMLEKHGRGMFDLVIDERAPIKMSRRRKRTQDEDDEGSSVVGDGHGFGLLDDMVLRNHGKGRIAEPDSHWLYNRAVWYSCMGESTPERPAGGQAIITDEERLALRAIWHMEFDFLYGKDNPLLDQFTSDKVMEEAIRRVKERMAPMFTSWRQRPKKRKAKRVEN